MGGLKPPQAPTTLGLVTVHINGNNQYEFVREWFIQHVNVKWGAVQVWIRAAFVSHAGYCPLALALALGEFSFGAVRGRALLIAQCTSAEHVERAAHAARAARAAVRASSRPPLPPALGAPLGKRTCASAHCEQQQHMKPTVQCTLERKENEEHLHQHLHQQT